MEITFFSSIIMLLSSAMQYTHTKETLKKIIKMDIFSVQR